MSYYELIDKYTNNIRPYTETPKLGSDNLYHYLYCTINTKNNKFYIGKHSHKSHSNFYYGSGSYLNASIKKHGKEVFIKFVFAFFDNSEEAYLAEQNIISLEMIKSESCYNRQGGGKGFSSGKNNYSKVRSENNNHWARGEENPIVKLVKTGISPAAIAGKQGNHRLQKASKNGTHPNANVLPWNHHSASKESIRTWFYADKVYDAHLQYSYLGQRALNRLYLAELNLNVNSIRNMLIYFKERNWNPHDSMEWNQFKSEYSSGTNQKE